MPEFPGAVFQSTPAPRSTFFLDSPHQLWPRTRPQSLKRVHPSIEGDAARTLAGVTSPSTHIQWQKWEGGINCVYPVIARLTSGSVSLFSMSKISDLTANSTLTFTLNLHPRPCRQFSAQSI